jgi:hypothetical protein|tara:strand:+ start:35 stop:742 length:708 start_codon:yes stop_codon:yes gene_type:complete
MAGLSYDDLVTNIRNYTEVDANVLTTAVLENIILNSQYRIMRDIPIDADKKQQSGNLVTGQETINAPAGCLYIRAIQVYDSTSAITGPNDFLLKKDISFLQEYVPSTESAKRGKPKYYAMFGGATGNTDTTSGRMMFAPVPDTTYKFRVHYDVMPATLDSSNTTNYISLNFPNGLLYACLVETYGFLKGPIDMLTLYENKYKQEVEKFAAEQIGRRRRDDYTDGAVRIPIPSANQ